MVFEILRTYILIHFKDLNYKILSWHRKTTFRLHWKLIFNLRICVRKNVVHCKFFTSIRYTVDPKFIKKNNECEKLKGSNFCKLICRNFILASNYVIWPLQGYLLPNSRRQQTMQFIYLIEMHRVFSFFFKRYVREIKVYCPKKKLLIGLSGQFVWVRHNPSTKHFTLFFSKLSLFFNP